MKNGTKNGKMTVYKDDNTIVNEVWSKRRLVSSGKVNLKNAAYFGNGVPMGKGSTEGVTQYDKIGY